MCVMSMVMDSKTDDWCRRYWTWPYTPLAPPPWSSPNPTVPMPTPQELDEFRRLLERAREYDKRTGQADCEMDEKRKMLKKMADALGVEIGFV